MQVDERILLLTCKMAALAGFVLECYRRGQMVEKSDTLLDMFKEMLSQLSDEDHRKVVVFVTQCIKESGRHAAGSDEAVILNTILERLSNGDAE